VGRDHLALGRRQRALAAQQDLGQLAHRPRSLGPERHRPADARQAFGQVDEGHVLVAPLMRGS
jgi:hypothetical protein